MMSGRRRDAIPGGAVGFVEFPARLLLRKLGGQGSNYFAGRGNLTALSQSEDQAAKYKRSDDRRRAIKQSFDFREQSVEILAIGAFVVGQPGLHQTTEAESVMVHTHHAATVRTLLVLVRRR
jgi:hypothetical protein